MNALVVLPVALPLGAAGLSYALNRYPRFQRVLGVATLTTVLGLAIALLVNVQANGVLVKAIGNWTGPIGITLAADLFSVIILVVSMVVLLAVLVYAIGSPRTSSEARFFYPTYLILTAGIALSLLTADLFNLFVAFEIMLSASYVLITLGGSRDQIRHGTTYVIINLLASMLFITAIGITYAAAGTVNMADLAVKLGDISPAIRDALGALFLLVFGIKAAIFPLFFWLPDSYPTAPAPVTAIFAGLLTKVGVYAIIRTQTLLFPSDGPSTLILVLAGLTMVVGVLGAIAQNDIKRILSFHIISQIGYMIMGLGLFTIAALAGAIFYIVHHILVKTALFLVGGLVEHTMGTSRLRRLGGMVHRAPFIAALFLIPALSLAGIPPLSGFLAKLTLVQAGLEINQFLIVGVSLAVSLLTLFSMIKVWSGVFWGTPDPAAPPGEDVGTGRLVFPRLMVLPTAALVLLTLVFVVAAEPLYRISEHAAITLLDPTLYIEAVLGR
ncbi:MAG: Na+/H+ antiporter subunit D [Actinomycetota bacterium]|nr:Na+/H+ antiporter subunit D [Actinomycetota bacterium]